MASPLILCRGVLHEQKKKQQPLLLLPSHSLLCTLHLLLVLLLCHVSSSSAAAVASLQQQQQQQDVVTSLQPPSSSSAALPPLDAAVIAAIASAAAAALSERESLLPETLNSHHHRLHVATSAGPPLIVGSEGAQRFFDRLHGYVDVKPVVQQPQQQHQRANNSNRDDNDGSDHDSSFNGDTTTVSPTTTTSASSITTKEIIVRHTTTSTNLVADELTRHDDNQNAAASNPQPVTVLIGKQRIAPSSIAVETAAQPPERKNWILHSATLTRLHSDGTETVEPIVSALPRKTVVAAVAVGAPNATAATDDDDDDDVAAIQSRQMIASLSDRIIGQLSAGNPWVNWTQSTGPVIVHSTANLPIGQFPFVVVVPTSVPVVPSSDQKPPRRGWFSFLRPWRIYGEGTESKFPPLFEGVVQRIQQYFSVYKYQDESRPSPNQPASDVIQPTVNIAAATDVQKPLAANDAVAPVAAIVQHGIEIESKPTTTATVTAAVTAIVANNDDASLSEQTTKKVVVDKMGDSNTADKYVGALESLNEITESAMASADARRNDKIIKIDKLNRV